MTGAYKMIILNLAANTKHPISVWLDTNDFHFTLDPQNTVRAPGMVRRHAQRACPEFTGAERRFAQKIKTVAAQITRNRFYKIRQSRG